MRNEKPSQFLSQTSANRLRAHIAPPALLTEVADKKLVRERHQSAQVILILRHETGLEIRRVSDFAPMPAPVRFAEPT